MLVSRLVSRFQQDTSPAQQYPYATFDRNSKERGQSLKFVCSALWKPYLKVTAKKAGGAVHRDITYLEDALS